MSKEYLTFTGAKLIHAATPYSSPDCVCVCVCQVHCTALHTLIHPSPVPCPLSLAPPPPPLGLSSKLKSTCQPKSINSSRPPSTPEFPSARLTSLHGDHHQIQDRI